jgi:predicted O-methyltransferase YrrM
MDYANLRIVDAALLNEYCKARGREMDGSFDDDCVVFHSWRPGFLDVSLEKAKLVNGLRTLEPGQWTDRHREVAAEIDALPWDDDGGPSMDDLAERARTDFVALQNRFEMLTLFERVAERRPRVIVEIGTAAGGMFYGFAQLAHREATLVSIDLPGGPFGGGNTERESRLFRSFLGPRQVGHFIRDRSFHWSTRRDLERILAGRQIDLLFIDGDHSYGGVVADFTMYSPLVAPGGMIAMHDIVLEPELWGRGADAGVAWKFLRESRRWEEIVDPDGRRTPPPGGRPKDYDDMARIAWGIGVIHV